MNAIYSLFSSYLLSYIWTRPVAIKCWKCMPTWSLVYTAHYIPRNCSPLHAPSIHILRDLVSCKVLPGERSQQQLHSQIIRGDPFEWGELQERPAGAISHGQVPPVLLPAILVNRNVLSRFRLLLGVFPCTTLVHAEYSMDYAHEDGKSL